MLDELRANGALGADTRRSLARKAFACTASYDAAIVSWFDETDRAASIGDDPLPSSLHLAADRVQDLRYGENPHQVGARYRFRGGSSWWDTAIQHGGKELSYLNLYDTEAAWRLVHTLGDDPAVAIIKHANPCGVAVHDDITTAYERAHECDPVSAFGGIVAINRIVPKSLAEALAPVFTEVVVAPGYEPDALAVLTAKKNLRVLEAQPPTPAVLDVRSIDGGLLVQTVDRVTTDRQAWKVVTDRAPDDGEWLDLLLAWRVARECCPTPSSWSRTVRRWASVPASRTAAMRAASRPRRRPGVLAAVRAPVTRSSRSATVSTPPPKPGAPR